MSNVINHYGILYGWQSEAIKKEQQIVFDDSPKAVESLLYEGMLRLRPGTLGNPFHFCMKLIFLLQKQSFHFMGRKYFSKSFFAMMQKLNLSTIRRPLFSPRNGSHLKS